MKCPHGKNRNVPADCKTCPSYIDGKCHVTVSRKTIVQELKDAVNSGREGETK